MNFHCTHVSTVCLILKSYRVVVSRSPKSGAEQYTATIPRGVCSSQSGSGVSAHLTARCETCSRNDPIGRTRLRQYGLAVSVEPRRDVERVQHRDDEVEQSRLGVVSAGAYPAADNQPGRHDATRESRTHRRPSPKTMLIGLNPSGFVSPCFFMWRSGENRSGSGNTFSSCIIALH